MDLLAFEIFSHLPGKLVFKFSIVSKQCHENLFTKLFTNKQCRNLEGGEDSCFFIQPKFSPSSPQLQFLCETFKSICGVPPVSFEFLSTTCPIIASYNGLLCCKKLEDAEYPLFLCNPVTKTWLPIIKPTRQFKIHHPFNFVLVGNQEDDYTLMYVGARSGDVWDNSIMLCKIYSPQKKAWEEHGEMVIGSRSIEIGSSAYLGGTGTIYFMSDWANYVTKNSRFYWPYIVSYDIRNSNSTFLKIPRPARKGISNNNYSCRFGIFKFKDPKTGMESLCLIKLHKLVFNVWVLADVDANTWKMIMKCRSKAMGLYDNLKPTISGFTVMNGNLLVIATGDQQLYGYTLTSDRIKSSHVNRAVKINGSHQCGRDDYASFYSYSNTFRPCGDDAVPFLLQ